jgi:hypothetical protein
MRERVVLVVVAARATRRKAEEDGCCRIDAVNHVLRCELLRNDSAFGVAAMVAIEPGGNHLIPGRHRQQIACQLFNRELVEWHVAVEGIDHPVAPPPHVTLAIALVAVAVGIAGSFQPGIRHALAIAKRSQQSVHHLLESLRRLVGAEGIELRGRRRQANEIQAHAAQPGRAFGFLRRRQAFMFQPVQHECIDGIAHPGLLSHGRQHWPLRLLEGPVALPPGTLRNPLFQQLDFARGERLGLAWHPDVGIVGQDERHQIAGARIARNNGATARHQLRLC